MKTNRAIKKDQAGFASIVIAIVLVLVLSLITVGFAQLMRKEQRSALDKQLSDQANYAAETGINDALKAIENGYREKKTDCNNVPVSPPGDKYLINKNIGDKGVSYSCLIINPTPTGQDFNDVDEKGYKVVRFNAVDASGNHIPVENIRISWQDGKTQFAPPAAADHKFPKASDWNYTGMLRLNLTPLDGPVDRTSLIGNTYSAFLYPDGTGPGARGTDLYTNGAGDKGGQIVDGKCNIANDPYYCSVDINVHGLGSGFAVALRSIYSQQLTVKIQALNLSGNPINLAGGQIAIDSTGKAQDVLRRIHVTFNPAAQESKAGFGAETTNGICKQLEIVPGGTSGDRCAN